MVQWRAYKFNGPFLICPSHLPPHLMESNCQLEYFLKEVNKILNLMRAQLKGASDENTKGVIICPVIREGGGGGAGGEGGAR